MRALRAALVACRYKEKLDSKYMYDYIEYPAVQTSRIETLKQSADGADSADLKVLVDSLENMMEEDLNGTHVVRARAHAIGGGGGGDGGGGGRVVGVGGRDGGGGSACCGLVGVRGCVVGVVPVLVC